MLFITYDGLLDPLGASQILPYVRGIAAHPRPVHILSFEKSDRFWRDGSSLAQQLAGEGIGWTPLPFTRNLGKLGKLWDLARMHWTAWNLIRRKQISIAHCRSYQAMQVSALLGRFMPIRTIFDMRGLWVDERIDGGIWSSDRTVDRLLYRFYKRAERSLLRRADHIVSLTERVIPELRAIASPLTPPVTVIPCCADFAHFRLAEALDKTRVRQSLGLPEKALVLGYLGSLGTWYLLDDMLRFFAAVAEQREDAHFLLVTRDWDSTCDVRLRELGFDHLRNRIVARPASRDQVPELLSTMDVMLSFIKPAYSKLASSPTKLAEAYALGIPSICNDGIGDVAEQTRRLGAGAIFSLDDDQALLELAGMIDEIAAGGGAPLRDRAQEELDITVAHARYRQVYDVIEGNA